VVQPVPGDYQSLAGHLNGFELDPGSTWLTFETVELDAQSHPIATSSKHWLSRLQADGPTRAALIAEGYLAQGSFSPDARRALLYGYDAQSLVPSTFHLFDLSDPTQIKSYALDLPYNWSNPTWSADSTYVSFIGGAPATSSRPQSLVDALNPTIAPRVVVECSGSPPPLPGCPMSAVFQP
ncbi:MAG TPA: hypothetical protein VGJ91_03540, partial [Polyangiaceae bacterium]